MASRKIKIYKWTFISKYSSISVSYTGKATVILSRVIYHLPFLDITG